MECIHVVQDNVQGGAVANPAKSVCGRWKSVNILRGLAIIRFVENIPLLELMQCNSLVVDGFVLQKQMRIRK
jgi:hypothetical protein